MGKIVRFGVSVEEALLKKFDKLIDSTGYCNRSEAIRDLIRDRLVRKEWKDKDKKIVGILGLVYNHEERELTENLTRIQHKYLNVTISSTHIHLDYHNCLEVIILKGKSGFIRKIADELISTKSVKHGDLIMTSTGIDV